MCADGFHVRVALARIFAVSAFQRAFDVDVGMRVMSFDDVAVVTVHGPYQFSQGCQQTLRQAVAQPGRLLRQIDGQIGQHAAITGAFTAFIPWMFARQYAARKKRPEATAVDYLKTLAISRMYLDNIDHIQSSWLTPGIKVCQWVCIKRDDVAVF